MRKWIGVCLSIVLVLYPCLVNAGGASSNGISERYLDTYLLSAGYPPYVVGKLDRDLKLELFRENGEFIRFEERNPSRRETMTPGTDGAGVQGVISDYYEWYLYSLVTAPTGYTRIKLSYSWSWLYAPFWCFHDKVAIAWSDDWASVPSTTSWKYTAYSDTDSWDWTGTTATSPSLTSKAYTFDILTAYQGNPITSHSGWLSTTVQHPTETGVGQIAVLARYFHQNVAIDGSISASGEPSLSISPSYAYDWSEGEADLYEFDW